MKELEKYITDEKTGLKYELVGDYYYPCLKAPETPKVGRFGMLYHDYLRNHKRTTYSGLMLSGKLKEQIEEVDRQAEEMFSQLVEQMKQAEDVTEQLKASNQMEWVRRMNNIRNRAEEIVESEVVFA
ncbi:MAG: TnpV protein [Clostridia bacterium]|nr:TnpV protein [Clostridia bacterium]